MIAATNRNLADEVRAGRMRADFYHRLSVYPLHVPPLRERDSDALLLAGYFLEENRSRLGLGGLRLSAAAQTALLTHAWPGNVRELEHSISRAVLQALSRLPSKADTAAKRPRMVQLDAEDFPGLAPAPQSPAAIHSGVLPQAANAPTGDVGLRDQVTAYERQLVNASLARHPGNWAAAARELHMDRANLQRLAKRLEIGRH